jgi:phosphoribosyl-AMP cyclohydrolase
MDMKKDMNMKMSINMKMHMYIHREDMETWKHGESHGNMDRDLEA